MKAPPLWVCILGINILFLILIMVKKMSDYWQLLFLIPALLAWKYFYYDHQRK